MALTSTKPSPTTRLLRRLTRAVESIPSTPKEARCLAGVISDGAFARQILSAIPDNRKELVIIPNAVHDTTYNVVPTLYMNTVLGFSRKVRKVYRSTARLTA